MSNKVIYSTGVLTVEPQTVSAVANVVNLDKYNSEFVTVEVWDWSSYDSPVQLSVYYFDDVLVSFPYKLDPNKLAVFYADLGAANAELFEIRIICSGNPNLIVNCFGRSGPPYESQVGNTVLQGSLVKLNTTCQQVYCNGIWSR